MDLPPVTPPGTPGRHRLERIATNINDVSAASAATVGANQTLEASTEVPRTAEEPRALVGGFTGTPPGCPVLQGGEKWRLRQERPGAAGTV